MPDEKLVSFVSVCFLVILIFYIGFKIGEQYGGAVVANSYIPKSQDMMCVGKYMGEIRFSSAGKFCVQPDNYSWMIP